MLSQHYQVSGAQPAKLDDNSDGALLYKTSFALQGEKTYLWSQVPRSLSDILKQESLPLVVKLCAENVAKSSPHSPVDLARPLLLYRENTGRRLHARNLRSAAAVRDVNRVVYQTTGPSITFSDNFDGFFKAIESRDEPLSQVADVSRLMPASFYSSDDTDGYTCISMLGSDTLYQKTSLPAGLYRPVNILEDTITYINRRKSEKKKLVRCLKCETEDKGKHVLYPLEGKGRFYIAEPSEKFAKHRNVDSGCRIYRWTEMDSSKLSGLRVKMLHGRKPQQECGFTGLVEFRHVTVEHTLIGATMSVTPRLFELAVTTEPFFVVALNSRDLDNDILQQKCLKFAKTECDSYMQAIKVRRDYDIDQAENQL